MKLIISDLIKLQEALDQRIFDLHNTSREATQKRRILAFAVELGELANETRCFKYWSLKEPSSKELTLEEYGDGIHFLLSLGIDLKLELKVIESNEPNEDISAQFMQVYHSMIQLNHCFNVGNYLNLFQDFLAIGALLDFDGEQIRTYYFLKNQKNHQRQDTNY